MKKNNNLLDEMQEQKLLKVESKGFALAFWGSFAAYFIQMVLNRPFEQYAGEMILFFVLCIYSMVFSMKNNIWDRKFKPDTKTNVIISLVASLIAACILGAKVFLKYPDKLIGSIASAVFFFGFVFCLCFVALSVSSTIYKKRIEKEEAAMDEEDDEVESNK